MTSLRFAEHEIHIGDQKLFREVFDFSELGAEDQRTLEAVNAVREPTKEEIALYELTSGKKASKADKAAADKAAAEAEAAAKKEAADKAVADKKAAAAKGDKGEDFV